MQPYHESPEARLLARIDCLERGLRRQRRMAIALGGVLFAGGMLAAARSVGDVDCEKLTCRRLLLLDDEQRPRIEFASDPKGPTGFRLLDKDGRTRLLASTLPDGACLLTIRGMQGAVRAGIGELNDGTSSVCLFDPEGHPQFDASVGPDGRLRIETAPPAGADAPDSAATGMTIEQARAEFELARKAYEAEDERVRALRAFQYQTTPLLSQGNQAWKEAPQIDPEVARRYHAARERLKQLEGR